MIYLVLRKLVFHYKNARVNIRTYNNKIVLSYQKHILLSTTLARRSR
jgi:hypothetical protein